MTNCIWQVCYLSHALLINMWKFEVAISGNDFAINCEADLSHINQQQWITYE